jgi:hypothetical protein
MDNWLIKGFFKPKEKYGQSIIKTKPKEKYG